MVDFNYFLNRKYNILQQQADQGDVTAAATARNAATAAMTGEAAAALDRTRNKILPQQAAAEIGLTNAQANLTGQQASVVVPVAQANIRASDAGARLSDANAGFVGTQNSVLRYTGLGDESGLAAPVRDAVRLQRRQQGFGLSEIIPARRRGESEAAYLDRINGL